MPRVQDRKYSTKQPLCVYARTCARLISLFVLTHLVGRVLSGHRMILFLHLSEFGSFLSDRSNSHHLQYFPSPAERTSFHSLSAIRNRAASLRQSVLNMHFAAWTDGFQEKHSKKKSRSKDRLLFFWPHGCLSQRPAKRLLRKIQYHLARCCLHPVCRIKILVCAVIPDKRYVHV